MKKYTLMLIAPMINTPAIVNAEQNFQVMLAESYEEQNVSGWLASEKLDGVRAYWNGKNLLSRQGNIFSPPAEFIANFPDFDLDGELYIGRGRFAETSGKVRSGNDWNNIKYYVFDVPNAKGGLLVRLKVLQKWLENNPNANIEIIPQQHIKDISEAQKLREQFEKSGGEGVILRSPNTDYLPIRTQTMLKLKSFQDDECIVVAYTEGRGKYQGKLGALVCKLKNGDTIKIGSGLSDTDRDNPPAIGSTITYRYNGLTKNGKPRFARFWRLQK